MTDINFDCPHCQQNLEAPLEMAGDSLPCPTCGTLIQVPVKALKAERPRTAAPPPEEPEMSKSPKSRTAAALCCLFLGPLGIHRFYVGKIGSGVAQCLTIGGLGIWSLIDLIRVLTGSFSDKEGRPLQAW